MRRAPCCRVVRGEPFALLAVLRKAGAAVWVLTLGCYCATVHVQALEHRLRSTSSQPEGLGQPRNPGDAQDPPWRHVDGTRNQSALPIVGASVRSTGRVALVDVVGSGTAEDGNVSPLLESLQRCE